MKNELRTYTLFILAAAAAATISCAAATAQAEDAVRARMMTPVVDGLIDEWKNAPQVEMRSPDVPDLKITFAAVAWDSSCVHAAVSVTDRNIVNKSEPEDAANGDCFEFRIASPDRSSWLSLAVSPTSKDGVPAARMVHVKVSPKEKKTIFASRDPADAGDVKWATARTKDGWNAEVSIPLSYAGAELSQGGELPFVMIVWDRDRTDIDEWQTGSKWHKRAESSSQKATVSQWPVFRAAGASAKHTVKVKSGIRIERHRPCNVFSPDEKTELVCSVRRFPESSGKASVILKDGFGRKCGEFSVPVSVDASGAAEFSIDFSPLRLGRGYYEADVSATTIAPDGTPAESSDKASFIIMDKPSPSREEFLAEGRRFGIKWWGGVTDKQETIDMMCSLGLLWTRAIVGETIQITTNSQLVSVVKIERFPKELFDTERYGSLQDWEKKFGRGSWTLKSVPKEKEYREWLAESLKKLPSSQNVFEIWNEPWDKMSPEDFSTISKWIREVVSEVRPDAKLGPNLRGDMSEYGYDAKVIAAGGMSGMDIVCLHPYATSEDRSFIRAYKKWISEKTGRDIDIYITEYGSHSCPSGPARRSELEQSAAVVRQSMALYAENARAIVPHWVGQSERNPTYHEDWFGFIRRNQQPKPVLAALANLAGLIDGGEYLGDLWFGPGLDAMVFRKNGVNVLALFTRGESRDVLVPVSGNSVTMSDIFGARSTFKPENGAVKITADGNPVYLIGLPDKDISAASKDLRNDRWPKAEKPKRITRRAHKMPAAPVFDGKFSEWSGAAQMYIHNPKVNGDDASGQAYVSWDENFLYVGADMRDNEVYNPEPRAKLYRGDSIELFVSTEVRDDNPGYGPRDMQLFLTPASGEGRPIAGIVRDREAGIVEDVKGAEFHVLEAPGKWSLECAIPWRELPEFTPAPGERIALEMRVNDADTSHQRWKLDPTDTGFIFVEDPSTWSVLELCE